MKFFQPETSWKPPPWASFDTIVSGLVAHRMANPYLREKHKWVTDYDAVADEVDAYNVKLCEKHGWLNFITNEEGNPLPKILRPRNQQSGLRAVAVGAESVGEFVATGANSVPHEQAEARAAVCAVCPKNGKGDFTTYFTVPLSNAIKEGVEMFKRIKLTTSHDADLKVCTACNCPLPFLVHFPVAIKYKHMSEQAKEDLWSACWIRKEMAPKTDEPSLLPVST